MQKLRHLGSRVYPFVNWNIQHVEKSDQLTEPCQRISDDPAFQTSLRMVFQRLKRVLSEISPTVPFPQMSLE